MPTSYPVTGPDPLPGQVVCFGGFNLAGAETIMVATPAQLTVMKTIRGVVRMADPNIPGQFLVYVAGEVVPAGTGAPLTGLGPGASNIVAVDANAFLVRVVEPDGSEFVVGTCNQAGDTLLQPRASRDTSAAHVFSTRAYGADENATPAVNGAALRAAMDAMMTTYPVDPFGLNIVRGAVLEIGPGIYDVADDLHVTREMIIRGWSAGGGQGRTVLRFGAGKGIIIDRYNTSPNPPNAAFPPVPALGPLTGHGDYSVIEYLDIEGTPYDLAARVDIANGTPVAKGTKVHATDPLRGTAAPWVPPTDENRFFFEAVADGNVGADPNILFNGGATRFLDVERAILSSTNPPAPALVEITTVNAHLLPNGLQVYIANHDNPRIPNGLYPVTVTGVNTFTVGVQGDNTVPGGATGAVHDGLARDAADALIVDGTVVWAVKAHAGVTLKARALVRKCSIQYFTNAGVLVATPYGTESFGGGGSANANVFRLQDLSIANCGMGVAVWGGDSNAGTGEGLDFNGNGQQIKLLTPTPAGPTLLPSAGGHGVDDFSFLGCTWVGCQADGNSGNSYRRTHPAAPSTFLSCYAETGQRGPHVVHPSIFVGGTLGAEGIDRRTSGLVLNPGNTKNLPWEGLEDLRANPVAGEKPIPYDPPQLIWGDIERPTTAEPFDVPTGNGGGVYLHAHTDEDTVGSGALWWERALRAVYFLEKYNDGLGGLPERAGEWAKTYGAVSSTANRDFIRYLGRKSTQGGKGNWCDPHGHFLGKDSGEHVFIGPASARVDPWIRAGGSPAGVEGLEQYRPGDQFWLQGDGEPGTFLGWTVKKAGYRGAPYASGTQYSGEFVGKPADLVQPSNSAGDEPPPTTRVFRASGSGVSNLALHPLGELGFWASFTAVGDTKTDTTAPANPPGPNPGDLPIPQLAWTWVGNVPTYARIGEVRDPAEERMSIVTNDTTQTVLGRYPVTGSAAVTITATVTALESDVITPRRAAYFVVAAAFVNDATVFPISSRQLGATRVLARYRILARRRARSDDERLADVVHRLDGVGLARGPPRAASPRAEAWYARRVDLLRQFEAIVDALNAAGVEHAICGGFAVNIHGHVRTTTDIDLLVRRESVDRALAALRPLGFDLDAGTLPFDHGTPRAREVRRVTSIEGTDALTVDLMVVTTVFDDVWRTRERLSWRGKDLTVVSREGLAAMKRLAGRHQDLADLEHLGLSTVDDDR